METLGHPASLALMVVGGRRGLSLSARAPGRHGEGGRFQADPTEVALGPLEPVHGHHDLSGPSVSGAQAGGLLGPR